MLLRLLHTRELLGGYARLGHSTSVMCMPKGQQQLLLPFGHAHNAGGMSQPGIASQQLASMQQPQEHLGMTSHGLLQHHQVTLLQQQQQQQHAGLASGPGINAGMLTQQTNTKAEQQPPM